MKTMSPRLTVKHLLVHTVGTMLVLSACGGSDAPEALSLVDDAPAESAEIVTDSTIATTTARPAETSATSTSSTSTTSTTTEAPPPEPMEPTLVVECATHPPTLTVTFADAPGTPIDWELVVERHPGGSDLQDTVKPLESGIEAPVEPLVYDIARNDLRFVVTSENASGGLESVVDVDWYTGCPDAGSTERRVVEQIDCVSGAFRFSPDEGSDIIVDSVVVDRVSKPDSALAVTSSGIYRVPGWTGPEEVKAIVTFSDSRGTYEEHINHWCFGGPFASLGGDYKVCADEAVKIAYPGDWVSTIDLNGPEGNSCSFFRYGPEDGRVDHNVTLESLGATTLGEATASLLPPGPWIIAERTPVDPGAFSDHTGTTAGGERIRFDLAWENAPTLVRRVVWLIEVDGVVWRLETNIQGLQIIDGMANSLQFVPQ